MKNTLKAMSNDIIIDPCTENALISVADEKRNISINIIATKEIYTNLNYSTYESEICLFAIAKKVQFKLLNIAKRILKFEAGKNIYTIYLSKEMSMVI